MIFEERASFESSILVDLRLKQTLTKYVDEFKRIKEWRLLYRASVDGFLGSDFHRKCDSIPNTVSIIRSTNGFVFGGFTTQTWDGHGNGNYKRDDNAFIFSLINADNNPQKFLIKPANSANAIIYNSNYGPIFGEYDFIIFNEANSNNSSYSKLGNSYNYSGGNSQGYLAGSYNFCVSEIEAFAITFFD